MPAPRPRLSTALAVIASLVLLLTVVTAYAERAVGDSDQFANRASDTLQDQSVRALISAEITDQLVLSNQEDLIAARPILQGVTEDLVGSRAFTGLFRIAVRDVHRAVFDRSSDTVTLTVADVGTVAAAALERLQPSVAREVSAVGQVELLNRNIGAVSSKATDILDRVRALALLLLLLFVALAAGSIVLAPDRRRAVVTLGVGAAGAGVVLLVVLSTVRAAATGSVGGPEERAAVGAIFDAFLGDLRTTAWTLVGLGAIVAAAAASLIRPVALGEPLLALGRLVAREPERRVWQGVRGGAFVLAGLLVLTARDAVLALLVTLVGAYLMYEGVAILLRLTEGTRRVVPAPAPRDQRRRPVARLVVAGALVLVAGGAFTASGATTVDAPAPSGSCNGHAELCDRPLDEVAFAATHNSMSVPLPGWFSAEHERPIPQQLQDGIRGLLIDTHYADALPNGRFRTVVDERAEDESEGLPPEALKAALRVRERLGFRGKGERGMYLCHSFCELGRPGWTRCSGSSASSSSPTPTRSSSSSTRTR